MKWPVLFCTYAYDSMLLQLQVMKSIHGSKLCRDTQHCRISPL